MNTDTIRDTFKHTTQWGVSTETFLMHRHQKSRNPALNIPCRHEAVATDTVFSDTPAVDSVLSRQNSLLAKNLYYLISTPYGLASNLSILWKTIFAGTVPVRRHHSNLCGHTDGLVMFTCSSDASKGQSS